MTDDSAAANERPARRDPFVLRAFGRQPTLSATALTVLVFAWIAIGSEAFTGTTALGGTTAVDVTGATARFVRDGVVRWPAAALLLIGLWRIRSRLPVNVIGRPQRPAWFPWATITLGVVAVIRLSVVSQFWGDESYTAATLFSELSTGVFEELAFRGLVLGGLLYGFGLTTSGVRKSLLGTTVLFGLVHGAAGIAPIIVTLLFGAVFLLSTLELRSLWPAAILHGLFDVGVNGGPPAGQAEWNETLMTFASVSLLLAGFVALGFCAFWNRWPIAEARLDGQRLSVDQR